MPFASYSFYTDVYHGTRLTEESFPLWASRADSWLVYLTVNRCKNPHLSESVLNSVQLCECALADFCFASDSADAADLSIQKETVGSHSVTYFSGSERNTAYTRQLQSIVYRYLAHTGLLSRSIPCTPNYLLPRIFE